MTRVSSILVSICAPGKRLSTRQLASWDADLHFSIAISTEMQARAGVLAALGDYDGVREHRECRDGSQCKRDVQ